MSPHVRCGALAAAMLGAASPAFAQGTPAEHLPDGTVRYPFPGPSPTLACAPLRVCTVMLQAGETITAVATGDSARWIISTGTGGAGGASPLVLVKPKEAGIATNLVIATTAHLYNVELTSSKTWSNPQIAFSYPEEERAAEAARVKASYDAELARTIDERSALPAQTPEKLDQNYRIGGSAPILPRRAYNDGAHTYVEFAALPTDLPVIVAVAPDGSNQIVNYRLDGLTYIVDGVQTGLDLVLNAGTGRRGSGERRVTIRHT